MKLVIILLTVLLAIFFANGFTSAGNPSNDGIRAYPYARYVTSKPPVKSTIKPTLRPTINPTVKAKGKFNFYFLRIK